MSLRRFAPITGLLAAAMLGGCAIQELRQDVDTRTQSVDAKQRELDALERTQAELAAERDRLLADLHNQQLTAAQLQARLNQMRRLNDSAPVRTPEQRQQREKRARQLDDATRQARQAQALERDTTLSQQEKAKRLQQLKDETSKTLRLLLVG